jgi:hypothetical protein
VFDSVQNLAGRVTLFYSALDTAANTELPSFDSARDMAVNAQDTAAGSAAPSKPHSLVPTSTSKRMHEHPTSSGTISPPHKLRVPPALSPDRNDLREALKIGGRADLDVKERML